jgi:uncharacterized protein YbjT (DUF2867 family)
MKKVAIFGAAGAIGHAVAPELVRLGIPFRAVGRTLQKLTAGFGSMAGAEIVEADLSDPQQAERAAEGVDTIVYLVGVTNTEFDKHPVLMRISLEAAARAGVARLLMVSGVFFLRRTVHAASGGDASARAGDAQGSPPHHGF